MVYSTFTSSFICGLIVVLASVTLPIQVLGLGNHYKSSSRLTEENNEDCLPTFTKEQCMYMQTFTT